MQSEKLFMFGGAAVLIVAALLGVNSMLNANALNDERIDGINKARSIGAIIAQDEATFGTTFRDLATGCVAQATDAKLPNAVLDYYVQGFKASVTRASDENYTPQSNGRWFLEAQRATEKEHPFPEAVLAKLDTADRANVEGAMTEISSKLVTVGDCLVEASLPQ